MPEGGPSPIWSRPTWTQIASGSDAGILSRIRLPGTELALWRRPPPPALGPALAALDPARYPDGRLLVRPADLPAALAGLLAVSGLPPPAGDALAADIIDLGRRFADLFGLEALDLRLEALAHDACWKFHRDHVPARLVTTYAGPGTEWVVPALGARAIDEQKAYSGPLERLAPGDVAIFRGCQPGHDHGIVHRSPPVAGTGVTRLFLCLNLPSPASPALWQAPSA